MSALASNAPLFLMEDMLHPGAWMQIAPFSLAISTVRSIEPLSTTIASNEKFPSAFSLMESNTPPM